ncbi:MAG: VOC family protein [Burkholderiaceae bacterium]
MKLAAVRLFVNDIATARDFYLHKLGLTLVNDWAEHGTCVFDAQGITVVVELTDETTSKDEGGLVGRLTGVSFASQDIHADVARLEKLGVEINHPPEQQYWGGWLAWIRDPSGNILELAQMPQNSK